MSLQVGRKIMILRVDNNQMYPAVPLFEGQEIAIGIDASKSNTGIAVGDMSGELLHWIEFNGKEDGTTEYDALRLCKEHRDVLKVLLKGANVRIVGIEDIITKVTKGRETGMTVHSSRFKITCVFASFIAFFQDNVGVTPTLINNWTWKSHILPAKYRAKDIGKGSLAYFRDIGSPLGYCSDDVTDAYCILLYLYQTAKIEIGTRIKGTEVSKKMHKAVLISDAENFKMDARNFILNPEMTLDQNITAISNNVETIGKARVKVKDLELSDIYKYCSGKFNQYEEELTLWVINERGGGT